MEAFTTVDQSPTVKKWLLTEWLQCSTSGHFLIAATEGNRTPLPLTGLVTPPGKEWQGTNEAGRLQEGVDLAGMVHTEFYCHFCKLPCTLCLLVPATE